MYMILLPLLFGAIDADTFTGKVIAVKDGDSVQAERLAGRAREMSDRLERE